MLTPTEIEMKKIMVFKTLILNLFLLCTCFGQQTTGSLGTVNGIFEVIKMTSYKGNNLETLYKITYKNSQNKDLRFFEVIKTDAFIKNHFLADFLLVERVKNNPKLICYPTGWESVKAIRENELKETCRLIVSGEITPEPIK